MQNILQIFEKHGFVFKKKASTLGGEYSGPCPWCSGTDRFSVHPKQDHYVCRQCHKAGDSIEFLKDYAGFSYIEACQEIGIQPSQKPRERLSYNNLSKDDQSAAWEPREIELPPLTWQNKAAAILFEAYKYLMSPAGRIHREYLYLRGLTTSTIKAARIGYQLVPSTFSLSAWGYSQDEEQALKTKIWLPEGFIIPYFNNGLPVRLRIRQTNPIGHNRFIVVPGSSTEFFNYNKHTGITLDPEKPWIITESELDGWLIHQSAGNSINVFAVGNSSARPDTETHSHISGKPGLINLDNDEAGRKEILWWQSHYTQSQPWLSMQKKDPGEDFQAGVDVKQWLTDGILFLDKKYADAPKQQTKQDFKAAVKIEKPVQKQEQSIEQHHQPVEVQPATHDPKTCIHGQYCNHIKNGDCMIAEAGGGHPVFDPAMVECPKQQWYRYVDPSGAYEQIIFGVEYKKSKHGRE